MVPTLPNKAAKPVAPTLSVVQVNVPFLSRAKPIHEAIAAALALGATVPIPAALTSV